MLIKIRMHCGASHRSTDIKGAILPIQKNTKTKKSLIMLHGYTLAARLAATYIVELNYIFETITVNPIYLVSFPPLLSVYTQHASITVVCRIVESA